MAVCVQRVSVWLVATIMAMLVMSCAVVDEGEAFRQNLITSNTLFTRYDGTTAFACADSTSGIFADTIRVYPVEGNGQQVIIHDDTFDAVGVEEGVEIFQHLNSRAKFHFVDPGNPAYDVELTWPGKDGHGSPGCTYEFVSDN